MKLKRNKDSSTIETLQEATLGKWEEEPQEIIIQII